MSFLLRTPQPRAAVAAGLRAAAEEGECEAVELLLGHDAKAARVADGAGRTPLHFAALSKKPRARDVATLLVLADPRGGREDRKGDTPAHVASRAGAAGALEALVAGGVDVDARNRRGETPVMVAAKHGQGAIVAYLRQVVTTRRAETERVVAVWECFFDRFCGYLATHFFVRFLYLHAPFSFLHLRFFRPEHSTLGFCEHCFFLYSHPSVLLQVFFGSSEHASPLLVAHVFAFLSHAHEPLLHCFFFLPAHASEHSGMGPFVSA